MTPHSRTYTDKACQLTGTMRGTASRPHFSSLFSGHYLRNRSTLDIGVLGYIGILYRKEHPPEAWHIRPGTSCIY
jgi:hypothetical protein